MASQNEIWGTLHLCCAASGQLYLQMNADGQEQEIRVISFLGAPVSSETQNIFCITTVTMSSFFMNLKGFWVLGAP